MAAGVGSPVTSGGKGETALLLHGQRVHVRPDEHTLAAVLAAHGGGDAVLAAIDWGVTVFRQLLLDEGDGLVQLEAQLRVLMQPAAVCNYLSLKLQRAFLDVHAETSLISMIVLSYHGGRQKKRAGVQTPALGIRGYIMRRMLSMTKARFSREKALLTERSWGRRLMVKMALTPSS